MVIYVTSIPWASQQMLERVAVCLLSAWNDVNVLLWTDLLKRNTYVYKHKIINIYLLIYSVWTGN
jgi:hypothetical protein